MEAPDRIVDDAAAVHSRIGELFAARRREEALRLIAPDVIDHRGGALGDVHGVDAWKAKWESMNEASVTVERNVSTGDHSVNRYTIRGTDPDTGRDYEITGIDMVRVRDGQIVEHWALLDSAALRHQVGVG